MRWNLRMVAAQQGIWKASDLRRALADHGLSISAGKMSNLWSGTPISIRLDDLDVICTVLDCTPADLLLPDPVTIEQAPPQTAKRASGTEPIRPSRRRGARTPPPACPASGRSCAAAIAASNARTIAVDAARAATDWRGRR